MSKDCTHIKSVVVRTVTRKSDGVVKRDRVCLACGARWADQVRLREATRGSPMIHRRIGMPASGAA